MAGTSLEALEPWRGADCYFCRCESTRTLNCVDYPFCKSELPRGLIPYIVPLRPLCKLSANPCRPREMLWSCNNEEPLCNLHITIGGINDPFREVRVLADSSTVGSGRSEQETMIQEPTDIVNDLIASPIRDESSVISLLCGYKNHNLRICKFQRWTTLRTSSSFEWTEIYIERLPSP